ncbi:MAG TPA: hypothetical protein VMF69_28625 [Gemmataceae bacterium]|nr:hypothetical protein [Gemmataceae bacterium]
MGRTILNKPGAQATGMVLLLLAFVSAGHADDKKNKGPEITDKIFRQTSSLLLDDPLNKSAPDWSRLILLYALGKPNADFVLGPEELRWIGLEKDDRRSLLLLAAYSSGNIQSQLNSGVKRNDRYSGLLSLFRVYRALRDQTLHDQKKSFTLAAVDELLALHKEAKLLPHLQKLEEKKQAKLTPAEDQAIQRLMRTR